MVELEDLAHKHYIYKGVNAYGFYTKINEKTICHANSKDAIEFRTELKNCKILFEIYNDILKAISERIECRNAKGKGKHDRAAEERKIDALRLKLDVLKQTILKSEIFKTN